MVGVEIGTDTGKYAGRPPAGALDLTALAGQPIHIGGRAAEVRDHAREPGDLVANLADLPQHRGFRAVLNDAPFVLGDRTEGAAAKASALNRDREADHLVGRDGGLAVTRMRAAPVGQLVDPVHFIGAQRNRRRIEPHPLRAMALHQRARISGIGLQVQDARGVRVENLVLGHLIVVGEPDNAVLARCAGHAAREAHHLLARYRYGCGCGCGSGRGGGVRLHRIRILRRVERTGRVQVRGIDFGPIPIRRTKGKCRAANVAQRFDGLAGVESMGDLADLSFTVAEHQQVGLGIEQYRSPHFFRPVIEVRDAAQRCLDAADHDGNGSIGLARALRVDDHRAVGALAALAARGIGIIAAYPLVGGVAIDHRIHIAGGDAKEQPRRTQRPESIGTVPIRLGDDAHAQALRFEHAAHDGHAEAGVIDIGIAGHDDHVALLPPKRLHFLPCHG